MGFFFNLNHIKTKCVNGCELFSDKQLFSYWEYNKITSDEKFILNFLQNDFQPEIMIVMVQLEVAQRIAGIPKLRGYLSAIMDTYCESKIHFKVNAKSFYPKPKVDSTVLSFKPKKNNFFKLRDPKNLEKITRILFSNRRKMINKNMKNLFKEKTSMLKNLNINLDKRPGELTNENYYKIAQEYEKLFD